MNINKILVPVIFTEGSSGPARQAAYLARHFHSEIILLHVLTPLRYPAGLFERGHGMTERDLHAKAVLRARDALDECWRSELEGITVNRVLLRGQPAREIIQTACDADVDLIVMPTHGEDALYQVFPGSVTTKVLHESERPVWTGAHLEESRAGGLNLRAIVCALDLTAHCRHTLSYASQLADEFGARLVVVHVTPDVEIYAPGGPHVVPEFEQGVVGYARTEMDRLLREEGTKAEVIIKGGGVTTLLTAVARETKADLLVIGHIPSHGHLGANGNGYSIIRSSRIPVLSV